MAFKGMLDALTEYRQNRRFSSAENEAQRIFEAQRAAISEIAGTAGFAEVRAFFEREYAAAIDRLLSGYTPEAAAVAATARRFLDFVAIRTEALAETRKPE